MAFFGPAGNSDSFFQQGYKQSEQVPLYLENMGLNAFEYQCGRGVNIGAEKCALLKTEAEKHNIKMSVHAPYYISLSSIDEEKRINSIKYILQSAKAVKLMGGNRIVVHTGTAGKLPREEAVEKAADTLKLAIKALKENNLYDVRICPETMGKINQLGTLSEVLYLCTLDENFIPCIDFGHLNARTMGGLKTKEDYEVLFNEMENVLGASRVKEFHSHFSKIEFSAGGEKRHLTFSDSVYGPNFEEMLEVAYKKGCNPTIICESAGTQAEDAKMMMNYWNNLGE